MIILKRISVIDSDDDIMKIYRFMDVSIEKSFDLKQSFYNVSCWARDHKGLTWVLIALFSVVYAILAGYLGVGFYFEDIGIPLAVQYAGLVLFIVGSFFYPLRSFTSGLFRHTYWRQKTCDLIVMFSALLMIATLSNHYPSTVDDMSLDHGISTTEHSGVVPLVVEWGHMKGKETLKTWLRNHKKEMRRSLKAMKKKYKEEGNKKGVRFSQVLLMILTLGGAFLLLSLVAALSCSLSCDGNDGAAAVVVIGGAGLIIWLSVIAFKAILRMHKVIEGVSVEPKA